MGTRLYQKQRKHKECGFVVTVIRGAVYKLLSEEQEADPELTGIGALAKADSLPPNPPASDLMVPEHEGVSRRDLANECLECSLAPSLVCCSLDIGYPEHWHPQHGAHDPQGSLSPGPHTLPLPEVEFRPCVGSGFPGLVRRKKGAGAGRRVAQYPQI